MKKIIFIFCIIFLICLVFFRFREIETNLLKAFNVKGTEQSSVLSNIFALSDKKLEVLFEANSLEDLEKKINNFPIVEDSFEKAAEVYKNYPINFLSLKTIELLKSKKYKDIAKEGQKRIYNPLGFLVASPNIDPYAFSTDFLLSLSEKEVQAKEFNGKFYAKKSYTVKSNQDIKNAIEYSKTGGIYLLGTPIHSYLTSQKSSFEINIIGFLVTFLLVIFFKFYFKSPKYLYYTILSIIAGIVTGFCFTVIIFQKIHILTLVFSTTIIGISLDYSIHYFLSHKEKDFWKNLTSCMLTTVFAFLILAFSQIRLLEEIAVFTSFGLIGVYLFVLTIMPEFDNTSKNTYSIYIPQKLKLCLIGLLTIIIIFGGYNINFNDDIKNLYKPIPELLKNEKLAQTIFPQKPVEFIIIEGQNIEEILDKEEKLNIKNSLSLSKFISSKQKQRVNIELVKGLYKQNLRYYAEFLSIKDRQALETKEYKIYDAENFPVNKMFSAGNNKSFVIVNTPCKNSLNPQIEYSKLIKSVRIKVTKLLPLVLLTTGIFAFFIFGIKKGMKILIPPTLGMITSMSFMSLCGIPINIFILISQFLILGFSLDYSIFLSSNCEKSKQGVAISAISTMVSFLILSFTSFYPIRLIGVTVFTGILIAYLLAYSIAAKEQSV